VGRRCRNVPIVTLLVLGWEEGVCRSTDRWSRSGKSKSRNGFLIWRKPVEFFASQYSRPSGSWTLSILARVISTLRTQHHGIFDAVQAHEGELAARLLREHIEWFHQQQRKRRRPEPQAELRPVFRRPGPHPPAHRWAIPRLAPLVCVSHQSVRIGSQTLSSHSQKSRMGPNSDGVSDTCLTLGWGVTNLTMGQRQMCVRRIERSFLGACRWPQPRRRSADLDARAGACLQLRGCGEELSAVTDELSRRENAVQADFGDGDPLPAVGVRTPRSGSVWVVSGLARFGAFAD
jgi:hypothetical protein